jgi:maleylacetate reductase
VSEFVLDLPATLTRFGIGCTARLKDEIKQSGGKALVVCTESGAKRYRQLIEDLGEHCVAVFDRALPHCPVDTAVAAMRSFILSEASCVVAIGGGSTLGLGKFITVNTGKPWFAVPTTFSGSEITSLTGIKIDSEKRTRKNPSCRAKVVFYDAALAATLPVRETVTTGMNCLAHCVEALYPTAPNPLSLSMAIEGVAILKRTLPVCVSSPSDLFARQEALYAGFIGGLMVEMVGIGMHHKICHVIGGHYNIAHADSNSAVLPHVVAFNQEAIGKAGFDLASALEAKDAASGIYALAKALEIV